MQLVDDTRLQRGQRGVAPEVNLRNPFYVGHKACKQGVHPDFETQGRCHQKSKTGVSVAIQKVFLKKRYFVSVSPRALVG